MTMGDIALHVRVGLVVQQVLFSVVEDLGPYNAIVCDAPKLGGPLTTRQSAENPYVSYRETHT